MRPPPSIVEKLLLPDPPGASGFNNDGSVLGLNEAALIKYLQIAQYAVGQLDSVKGARELVFAGHKEAAPLLESFLLRAFRRPVGKAETAVYLGVYEKSRAAGESFDRAIKDVLMAALTSSNFLYRIEAVEPGASKPYLVSDFELATRLAYFLWSSTPDGELLRLAGAGKLSEPAVLSAQVQRMLKSPKIRELSRNFAGQWLGFRELLDSSTLVKGGNKLVNSGWRCTTRPFSFSNTWCGRIVPSWRSLILRRPISTRFSQAPTACAASARRWGKNPEVARMLRIR